MPSPLFALHREDGFIRSNDLIESPAHRILRIWISVNKNLDPEIVTALQFFILLNFLNRWSPGSLKAAAQNQGLGKETHADQTGQYRLPAAQIFVCVKDWEQPGCMVDWRSGRHWNFFRSESLAGAGDVQPAEPVKNQKKERMQNTMKVLRFLGKVLRFMGKLIKGFFKLIGICFLLLMDLLWKAMAWTTDRSLCEDRMSVVKWRCWLDVFLPIALLLTKAPGSTFFFVCRILYQPASRGWLI